MNNQDSPIKPCSVILERLTPQKQLALSAELKQAINERNMLTTRTRKKVTEALEQLNDKSFEAPKNKKKLKNRALEELLESEVKYLRQLELIINFFMKPIRDRKLIHEDDFRILFGNIETIYNVNGELLQEIRENTYNVAKAFRKMAPYFKLYSMLAYDYKTGLNILQREERERSDFFKFVEAQESRPEVQSKLMSLLIAPIQRIPRYRMLLKQILEYTSPEEEDYSALDASVRRIEDVARHINGIVEDQENTQSLLALQRCLLNQKPHLIKPGRRIIKEGVLYKISHFGKHYKRYFVLMNDILMFCKMKNDDPKLPNSLKCMSILPLNKCKVTEVVSKGCFKVNCQDEEVIAYHSDPNVGKEWVRVFQDTVRQLNQNRQTLRKESSQRKPVKRKHLSDYEESGISPGKPMKRRHLWPNEEAEKTNAGDAPKSEAERKRVPFLHIRRRRNIRDVASEERPTQTSLSSCALRTNDVQVETRVPDASTSDLPEPQASVSDTQVYRFGTGQNRGISFGLGTVFRGIRNSVKTMLGLQ